MSFDARLLSGIAVLSAVVEQGSFTRAGVVLGLSPSGVSRALSRLERRVAVRLLDRSTRALRLTAEGARLYELAAPHLIGLEDAASAASQTAVEVSGTLMVSVAAAFARQVLAPRLPNLLQRHPSLTVILTQHSDIGDLVTEGVDIAVRFGPQPPSSMISRLLLETRVLTVAAPSYLDRQGRPKHPNELSDHLCLQYVDPRAGRPFDWEFHQAGVVLPVTTSGPLTFSDVDTMIEACRAGAGVAQVLALSVGDQLARGELVELFPNWSGETFPLYAIHPSRRFSPAKVSAFIEFCLDAARCTR